MVTMTKTTAKKMLGNVPEEKLFWCHDGKELKNLAELERAFRQMSEETFLYHLNQTKNDFSNWVKDVIGDEELAENLKESTTRTQAARHVNERITQLKRQLALR